MLSAPLDIQRIRQYFNVATLVRELAAGVRDDASLVDALRRAVLPLPFEERRGATETPFPPVRRAPRPRALSGRVALVASGGSGALAALVGVARALEERRVRLSALSVSSGAALFGFPLAAGLTADEVAEFTLSLTSRELVDLDWKALSLLGLTAARGFTGLLRGERVERAYRQRLGSLTLGDMPIPAYAPVWNVERNRLEYLGPHTHPGMEVARAVRMAMALPLFVRAVPMGRHHYYDGGSIDILPVVPLLDIEPRPDAAIVVNCFYPHELRGEDVTGWTERAASIMYAASQIRSGQHMELARRSLARLRAEVGTVVLVEPVPYATVAGAGLYRQFVDGSRWAEFMRAGRTATVRALGRASAQRPRRLAALRAEGA